MTKESYRKLVSASSRIAAVVLYITIPASKPDEIRIWEELDFAIAELEFVRHSTTFSAFDKKEEKE
jgi:hypothetical protein